eukprot:scaffold3984_cov155-Amphora_coffeaeformis.AAC.4
MPMYRSMLLLFGKSDIFDSVLSSGTKSNTVKSIYRFHSSALILSCSFALVFELKQNAANFFTCLLMIACSLSLQAPGLEP